MATQSSSISSKTANNPCQQASQQPTGKKPRSAATMVARAQASARYRQRNLDEEREKGRARMARHREKILEQGEQAEEFRSCAREASRRFRQKNAKNLAHHQRILHLECVSHLLTAMHGTTHNTHILFLHGLRKEART
ncbi:hypothetical protein B0H14DRAFT_3854248, partial [Mycena olivaceomarginata]